MCDCLYRSQVQACRSVNDRAGCEPVGDCLIGWHAQDGFDYFA